MLSIIIPALNEEKQIGPLLKLLKNSSFPKDCEIIVADAGSKDRTAAIARSFGCVVVKGGLPAVGRNTGARTAKGELLLFLDSDVTVSENFLENSLSEFKKRNLVCASYRLIPKDGNIIFDTTD